MTIRRFLCFIVAVVAALPICAQEYNAHFEDATLRIDYTLLGNASEQHVALRDMSKTDNWWGHRVNLNNVPMKGNGDLTLYDAATNEVLYKTSFSSLFQEWITTHEAQSVTKSFEFTLLVPMPKQDVIAEI